MDDFKKTIMALDNVAISRRHLLGALGLAAVTAPMSHLLAQGSCAGTDRDNTPACNKQPMPAPFAPTGWKTVMLDHFTMTTPNPRREAAYYVALMNWKVRSDDGNEIMMDIGDWGGVLITQSPPAPPAPPAPAAPPAAPAGAAAAGGAAAGRAGGGGGGGGGGRAGGGGPSASWNGFAWGIDNWNRATVERELRARNLNPVAYNRPGGFESFLVHDPDGFPVWITNGNKGNRRTTPANGRVDALPFAPTNWQTTWLDHISHGCTSYKESVAFYQALLGWEPRADEGSQNEVKLGDVGDSIIRGGNALAPGGLQAGRAGGAGAAGAPADPTGRAAAAAPLVRRTTLGHISFGITGPDWARDPKSVAAELAKRTNPATMMPLNARVDTGGSKEIDAPDATYRSYHTTTPDRFDLQISNINSIAVRGG